MTTAPMNEMLALADEIEACDYLITPGRENMKLMVSALRLAATPSALAVREACKAVAKRIGEVAERNIKDGTECCLATVANTCDDIIQGIDNLDAAAPAAGGDERLPSDLDKRFKWLRSQALNLGYDLVAEPQHPDCPHERALQAPAHSDAVRAREFTDTIRTWRDIGFDAAVEVVKTFHNRPISECLNALADMKTMLPKPPAEMN